MPEHDMPQPTSAASPLPEPEDDTPAPPVQQMIRVMEGWSSNLRTADQFAYLLARRTPITLVICLTLLLAGIIGSRLGLWIEPFLWGIPSLGAVSMGVGIWLISATILGHPRLSGAARSTLQRAVRLQYVLLAAAGVTLIYFFGMALQIW